MRMESTAFSLLVYPKLRKPTALLMAENVFRLLPNASYKILSFQSTNTIPRAYANTRETLSLKSVVSSRALQEDDNMLHKQFDVKSENRKRLVALFKRIKTSISEGEPRRGRNRKSAQESNDDSSAETSVLEFLQQSSREATVTRSKQKRNGVSTQKRTTKKEKQTSILQPPPEIKLTHLPSNFVKKSPLPSPTPLRSNDLEVTNRNVSGSEVNRELSQIEAMKLSELKELAKERGVRGYSKLRKSELIELLSSQVDA